MEDTILYLMSYPKANKEPVLTSWSKPKILKHIALKHNSHLFRPINKDSIYGILENRIVKDQKGEDHPEASAGY